MSLLTESKVGERQLRLEPWEMLSHSSSQRIQRAGEPEVGRLLFGDKMVRAGIRARRSSNINLQLLIENKHRFWSTMGYRQNKSPTSTTGTEQREKTGQPRRWNVGWRGKVSTRVYGMRLLHGGCVGLFWKLSKPTYCMAVLRQWLLPSFLQTRKLMSTERCPRSQSQTAGRFNQNQFPSP